MPRKGGCLYKAILSLLPSWGQAPHCASSLRASEISTLWYWRERSKGDPEHMDKLLLVTPSFPCYLIQGWLWALDHPGSVFQTLARIADMPLCLSTFSCDTSVQVYKRIMTTLSYKLIRDLQEWFPNLITLVLTAASDPSWQDILALGLLPHQKLLKPLPLHLVIDSMNRTPPHSPWPFRKIPNYLQHNRCQPTDTCRKTAAATQLLVICMYATFSQSVLIHSLKKGSC